MGYPGLKGEKGDMGPSGSPVSDSVEHSTHHITSHDGLGVLSPQLEFISVIIQREGPGSYSSLLIILLEIHSRRRDTKNNTEVPCLIAGVGRQHLAPDDRLFFFCLFLWDITSRAAGDGRQPGPNCTWAH